MTMMEDDRDADRLKTDTFFPRKQNQIPQEIIEKSVFDAMLRKVRGMMRIEMREGDWDYNQAIDEVLKVLCPNGQDKQDPNRSATLEEKE